MKKALSVLLVAAALFGFYGSAVTVNDLLACKDYWEEAGEKSTADMNKLEDGLNQLLENEDAYLDGLDQIADAEVQLAEGEKTLAKGEADYAAAPGKLAKGKADLAAGWAAYKDGKKTYDAGKKEYNEAEAKLNKLKAGVSQLKAAFKDWDDAYQTALVAKDNALLNASDPKPSSYFDVLYGGQVINTKDASETYTVLATAIQDGIGADTNAERQGKAMQVLATLKPDMSNMSDILPKIIGLYGSADAPSSDADAPAVWGAAKKLGAMATITGVHDGKPKLVTAVNTLLKELKGNKEAEEMISKMGFDGVAGLMSVLETAPDNAIDAQLPLLFNAADKLIESSDAQLAAAAKKLKAGKKELDAGLKKLKKGEKEYAQGLADYKAAPAKLEDGRQQLADGYKQYEDGKAQLAQYEDGEQQIRDGLATLFNTEADLDLVSIADRLNGDGDFDNGDNHLEIEEGLNAVEVGRGYQAEDGDLITAEIMGRAVATGGLLAAGVLAVLAAILSFLKKNKAAGVFALLAAAAGAFGAFFGPAQGTYFSEIAGSTIGTLTWVAAGVLGAVALVHAIVHFAAPKNA